MNLLRDAALSVAFTFSFVGCSTTGGTIGGLLPAPKVLKGEIKDSVYIAQDQSFSVAVPHKEGSYEYKYMQVKEQYSEHGAYVSFGPAAFDQNIYRVETAKRITPDSASVKFDDAARQIVENYKAQLQKGYGSAIRETESRQERINGRNARYWNLSQVVPAGRLITNKPATLTHEVYVIDFDKSAAVVWVEFREAARAPAIASRAFAESVVIR